MNLSDLITEEQLKEIIVSELGYDPVPNISIPLELSKEISQKLVNKKIIAQKNGFQVLLFNLDIKRKNTHQNIDQFFRSTEREFISRIPSDQRQNKLFIFRDEVGKNWHFVRAVGVDSRFNLRRFSINPENRAKLRTLSQQLLNIKTNSEDTLQQIINKHEEAFSVEAVSTKFFNEFKEVFEGLKSYLIKQNKGTYRSDKHAHDFALRLLNRLIFLYFVQKKGIFSGNKEFLRLYWSIYRNNFDGKNQFLEKWLKILFFESMNGKFHLRDYFKSDSDKLDINSILIMVPHLNGGLFRYDNEVDSLDYQIEDSQFEPIFSLLENYNFTVKESTPLEQDLDIDPEIMGNIYEMLVNISETEDEQHQLGIFYTQKVEIDLMLRRSLVEYIFGKTGIEKDKLYQFIFLEKKEQKVPKFSEEEIIQTLTILDNITIVDPACGSGHYLVVAAQILWELKTELSKFSGKVVDKFEEKKKILQKSIYGVDVKEWATEIAKLRLWLDLIVDATEDQLKTKEALLPNLTFKIRVGDSLVQEIGGVYFSPSQVHGLNSSLRGLLITVKDLKRRHFNNENVEESQVLGAEKDFYRAIIDERIERNKRYISQLEAPSRNDFREQLELIKLGEDKIRQQELPLKDQKEIDRLSQENKNLESIKVKLDKKQHFAFWPIEFADIFSDRDGFDIVIANPPYVRQEIIADPTIEVDGDKKVYKDKLEIQLKHDWENGSIKDFQIDKKSDLYVYFYLKGLKLLNKDGVMCFISSNSWLDVGYGKELQSIMLRYVPIVAIYDNQAKRSFKHADINTIIFISRSPYSKEWSNHLEGNVVRFVMFKKPFEEVSFSETFTDIEAIKNISYSNDDFRSRAITQRELYEDGLEILDGNAVPTYESNKWGGKYLRAPDIYWKIITKAGDKIVKLHILANTRRGFTTGANEFFYLNNNDVQRWGIEDKFLKNVITSPQESKKIDITNLNTAYKVFVCHEDLNTLLGSNALKYIKWGERAEIEIKRGGSKGRRVNGYQTLETTKNRIRWYDLGSEHYPDLVWNYLHADISKVFYNGKKNLVNNVLYEITFKDSNFAKIACLLQNSTLENLIINIHGRTNYGEGVLSLAVFEVKNIPVINPKYLSSKDRSTLENVYNSFTKRELKSIFEECGIDPRKLIREQEPNPLPDRKKLDDIIFNMLSLTNEERKEVYWGVCELVQNRLKKAESV